MKLLKVDTTDQVKGKIHRYFRDLELHVESVDLTHGRGRVLAEDVVAPFHVPEFNRSTVDGYALISRDTFGVSDSLPVFLEVLGSVEMGKAADLEVTSGKAVYIPTGGMIPQGACRPRSDQWKSGLHPYRGDDSPGGRCCNHGRIY